MQIYIFPLLLGHIVMIKCVFWQNKGQAEGICCRIIARGSRKKYRVIDSIKKCDIHLVPRNYFGLFPSRV